MIKFDMEKHGGLDFDALLAEAKAKHALMTSKVNAVM